METYITYFFFKKKASIMIKYYYEKQTNTPQENSNFQVFFN